MDPSSILGASTRSISSASQEDNMSNKKDYRRDNGRKLEGHGLAARIAKEVTGMALSQAYVVTKSAGYQININKFDGVPHRSCMRTDKETINVDVVAGIVKKSWLQPQ